MSNKTTRNLVWVFLGLVGTVTLVIVLASIAANSGLELEPTPGRAAAARTRLAFTPAIEQSATPRPSDTPAPPTATPTPSGPVIHVIQSGETMLGIALQYGVTVDDILRANNMDDANFLSIGQQLVIPIEPPTPEPSATPTQSSNPNEPLTTQGTVYACPANASSRQLALPGDPISLVLSAGQAFFVADGGLYAVPLNELAGTGPLAPSDVMPPDRQVGPYTIYELVYATADPASGDLLLLDKSGDIYRRTTTGEWRMEIIAAPVSDQLPNPQYVAVQAQGSSLYMLDPDLARVWKLGADTAVPATLYQSNLLAGGIDMALLPGADTLVVLTRNGLVKFVGGQRDETFGLPAELDPIAWPAQVSASSEHILIVDGEARRVMALNLAGGQTAWQVVWRFANMQRLRSAAAAGDTLYALAGRALYIVKMSSLGQDCPEVSYDNTLYFDGVDIRALTTGFTLPLSGASLPTFFGAFPGARWPYHYGVRHGLELNNTTTSLPVTAIADGAILRADTAYTEMTPREYETLIARIEAAHYLPPDLQDKLLGRQVRLLHSFGVESCYAHLDAIAPDIVTGHTIQQDTLIGASGASGSSDGVYGTAAGGYLHLELWINGRYLGQGLGLYETMRLWQAVFQ